MMKKVKQPAKAKDSQIEMFWEKELILKSLGSKYGPKKIHLLSMGFNVFIKQEIK